MNNLEKCPKCGTTVEEILESGFVGCQECYKLPRISAIVDKMYKGKAHKD